MTFAPLGAIPLRRTAHDLYAARRTTFTPLGALPLRRTAQRLSFPQRDVPVYRELLAAPRFLRSPRLGGVGPEGMVGGQSEGQIY